MITYPVNPEDRFTVISGGITKRRQRWPRADYGPIVNPDPSTVIMLETSVTPDYNPATQRLDNGHWVDDAANELATYTWDVVDLTAEELAVIAENARRDALRTTLAAGIETMREWADQMDAVTVTDQNLKATLQTTIDRLPVFFRGFADLLENLRIDQ